MALDNAHSAAELSVQAYMLTMQEEARRHRARREWLTKWAELKNAPQDHAHILWNLVDLRDQARYGEATLVEARPIREDHDYSPFDDRGSRDHITRAKPTA